MPKKFNYGLFVGRFQPFHKGHLHAIEFASSRCKTLLIGVGSSKDSGTKVNPLSADVRIKIIKAGLKGTKIKTKQLKFFEIPDFHNNEKWFNYINRRHPGIDVVFSHNELVERIFKGHHIAVITPKWYKRKKLIASKIRYLIRHEKKWKDRVPKGSVKEIAAHESVIKHEEN